MGHSNNPYKWTAHQPKHPVRREELLTRVTERILCGESGYLVGCRGMGKSVFMRQLVEELRSRSDVEVFFFPKAQPNETLAAEIEAIADQMVQASANRGEAPKVQDKLQDKLRQHSARQKLRELFDTYLKAAPTDRERVVLLYDELDGYAGFGRPFFSEIEDIRKNSEGQIVVFAAGGLGLMALDTLFGSPFFSRATPEILEPFDAFGLGRLAEPFEERGTPLSPEVLETLRLASGGNLALSTFCFHALWVIDAPSPRDVTEIFGRFRDKHVKFLDAIRDPVFDTRISNAPELVWREFQQSGQRMTQKRLRAIVQSATGTQKIKEHWVFDMLRSTGLIRASDDAYRQSDIEIEIIPSILTLDVAEPASTRGSLRDQLVADLCDVLASIHRMAPDFFRSTTKNDKQILPEAVFAAALILGLEPRGWKAEREAQSAAGRTDIKARHPTFVDEWVVIEVKLWGRNDYDDIHAQVRSYWTDGVNALATVMVADLKDEDWAAIYEEKCLKAKSLTYEQKPQLPVPVLTAHFVARTDGCAVQEIDHFLLRLPKRQ